MKSQKSFEPSSTGKLYLVPTPIGNLEDMTYRAVRILQEADLIAAEDTRQTQKLLNHFEVDTSQISFHEHNWKERVPELIEKMQNGLNLAQVSDAGMPSISDPGQELVKAAVDQNIPVIPLPGASAGVTALIASGLVPQPFYFYGFLARKKKEQLAELETLNERKETIIFYESPHRLKATLKNIQQVMGAKRLVVLARELTKRYEEFLRGTAEEAVEWAETNEIRGEFCLLLEGNSAERENKPEEWTEWSLKEHVEYEMSKGLSGKEAIKEVAQIRQIPKREVYAAYHGI